MSSSPSSDSPSEVGPRYHGVKRRDVTVPASDLTKSGNKKRVRRIQKELPILRQEVQELELKLTRLQFQATSKQRTNTNDLNQKSQDGNLWNCIAERQLKERLRVEQEQLELKDLCNEVSKYSSELQTLFTRFEDCRERVGCRQQHKFWDFRVHHDDEIFSEHMLIIAKLWRQCQNPGRTMYFGSELTMGKDIPRLDPSVQAGIVFDTRCGVLLPFSLDVVTEAYWKFFGLHEFTVDDRFESMADVITRSSIVRTNLESFASEAKGKYLCQKRAIEDGVVLMWSGVWDITEYGGVMFRGMQLHHRGLVKLRRVSRQGPGQQSTSTIVETNLETIPVFDDNITDQIHQIQIFSSVVTRSFSTRNSTFSQMMSELLLKEDWKVTLGSDKLET
ncbi:hypothetical protein PHPALM_29048 [Phytophthora palmivora]|uniref:M96 mating-specific protein family n=1 Tax=Phytophthora palmivora TaxID=4796 RepID=A0A2P4X8J0_9STRA|nr:hypothetical protein PHPALM_29048 [Phytophthora palmivora]